MLSKRNHRITIKGHGCGNLIYQSSLQSRMVKTLLLASAPGVVFNPPEPNFNSFPPPQKFYRGQRILQTNRPQIYLPLREDANADKVQEILELPETETEVKTEKGFDRILDQDKKDEKKIELENDKGFEQAAKKFIAEETVRRDSTLEEEPPKSSPPIVVKAGTANIAAAANSEVFESPTKRPRRNSRKGVSKRKPTPKKNSKPKQTKQPIKARLNQFRVQ